MSASWASPIAPPFAWSGCTDDPLGLVEVELPLEGVSPPALAAQIEAELGAEIGAHLDRDGLARRPLRASGLIEPELPACLAARNEFLGPRPLRLGGDPDPRPSRARRRSRRLALLGSRYPDDRFELIVVDNRPLGEGLKRGGGRGVPGPLSDKRVRVLREPVSGGANARNRGLARANGEDRRLCR